MEVLEDDENSASGREPVNEMDESLEEAQTISASRRPRAAATGVGEQRLQIVRPGVSEALQVASGAARLIAKSFGPQRERESVRALVSSTAHLQNLVRRHARDQLLGQTRLAHAGFSQDSHHTSATLGGRSEVAGEGCELDLPGDEPRSVGDSGTSRHHGLSDRGLDAEQPPVLPLGRRLRLRLELAPEQLDTGLILPL